VKAGFALFYLPLLCAIPLQAESVLQKDGNIFLTRSDAETKQLTVSGKDSDPNLSPDGKLVVFVRDTPERLVKVFGSPVHADELWVIDSDGTHAHMIARGGMLVPGQGFPAAGMMTPQFGPDGRTVFFVGAGGVSGAVIYRLNLADRRVRLVTWGHSMEVLREGAARGCLIVDKHKYFLQGGSYDWYWLLTPGGKEVGPIGEDDFQVQLFKEMSQDYS